MTFFEAIILGAVQGLAEFLPISSSAHLIIVPYLFGDHPSPLYFDLILHLGTTAALVLFFWKDLWELAVEFFRDALAHKLNLKAWSPKAKMVLLIGLGCVPAVIAGLLFNDFIETQIRSLWYVIIFMSLGSVLMYSAEKFFSKNPETNLFEKMDFKKAGVVGLFQSLALLPGISRSGSTISSGMFMGLSREEAAKFSFLMSVPITLMATAFELLKNHSALANSNLLLAGAGLATSFISGIFCIKFLLDYLKSHSLNVFVIYRLLVVGLCLFLVLR